MNWKEAKKWAREDAENRDWRDQWRYGDVIRGLGLADDTITFDWGVDATEEQKGLITTHITSLSKWARRVEELLDNPPRDLATEVDGLKEKIAELEKLK